MSDKGQVVVPKQIRDKHGYGPGSAFTVIEGKDGGVTLQPVKSRPKGGLIQQLPKFQGLEVPEMRVHCPPRL